MNDAENIVLIPNAIRAMGYSYDTADDGLIIIGRPIDNVWIDTSEPSPEDTFNLIVSNRASQILAIEKCLHGHKQTALGWPKRGKPGYKPYPHDRSAIEAEIRAKIEALK